MKVATKTRTTYRWKPGAVVKIDAGVAGREMEKIKTRNGGKLTPDILLAEAAAPKSPLRKHFEWNDARAAHAFRLEQAGYMIRSIEVYVPMRPKGEEVAMRAYVSVTSDEEDRSYISIVDALSDPGTRAQVVSRARRELEAWRDRYAELSEFAAVFAAMKQARSAR
jgi:hypothetical protein